MQKSFSGILNCPILKWTVLQVVNISVKNKQSVYKRAQLKLRNKFCKEFDILSIRLKALETIDEK